MPVSSKRVLLFFLSLCGIYKGNINDIFIRKELSFLVNDKSDLFNIQTARKIYNSFLLYRKSLINKVIEKNKTKKNDSYKLNKKENNSKRIDDNYDPILKQEKELFIKRKKKIILYIPNNNNGYKSFYNIRKNFILKSNKDNEDNDNSKNLKKIINNNKYKIDMIRIKIHNTNISK